MLSEWFWPRLCLYKVVSGLALSTASVTQKIILSSPSVCKNKQKCVYGNRFTMEVNGARGFQNRNVLLCAFMNFSLQKCVICGEIHLLFMLLIDINLYCSCNIPLTHTDACSFCGLGNGYWSVPCLSRHDEASVALSLSSLHCPHLCVHLQYQSPSF